MRYMDFGLPERELEALILAEAEAALGPGWRTGPSPESVLPAMLAIMARAIGENNRRLTEQLHALGIGLQT